MAAMQPLMPLDRDEGYEPVEKPPPLYWNARMQCYECLGCQEPIEPRRTAWMPIHGVMTLVRIEGQPENKLLWLELHELDHADCAKFKDVAKAKDYREHRRRLQARARRGERR